MNAEPGAPAAGALTDGETILARTELPASADRIFRALTTDEVERWWGSADTYRVTDWRADLFVGGKWHLVVRRPDGSAYPASGIFVRIDPPHTLVHTRRYEWDYPLLGRRETTVAFRLTPLETGTRVTVRHDGFSGLLQAAEEHAAGWIRFLGWFSEYTA